MKSLVVLSLICIALCFDEARAFGAYGAGAPGPRGQDYRPISPGGDTSDRVPPGAPDQLFERKNMEEDKGSPQLPPGYEQRVGVSSVGEITVPIEGVLGFEHGVQEAKPLADSKGCEDQVDTSIPQPSCPTSLIDAMWEKPSFSKTMEFVSGGHVYRRKRGGYVRTTKTYKFQQSMQRGGLCGSIDAAFTAKLKVKEEEGLYTVYFSGDHYSVYKDALTYVSGPHSIHTDYESGEKTPLPLALPRYVKKVDAALMWWENHVYFFFKYNDVGYFSAYDPETNQMISSYPRRTDKWWKGLPEGGPDSAYYSSNSRETYFTKGKDVFIFKEGRRELSKKQTTANNFIKCV